MSESSGVIFVGKKPALNYAVALMSQINSGVKHVTLKARGSYIVTAVKAVEIARRRLLGNLIEIRDVKIGSETVGEGENMRMCPMIEIVVERKTK